MKIDSCFELGHVIKIHGLKGELSIFLDVDDPSKYENIDSVYIEINRKLVPFLIKEFNLQGSGAIVKFEDVDEIESARELLSCKLYLPLKMLPDLGDENFYLHEIIGFIVIDATSGKLGPIKNIYDSGGSRLIGMDYNNKEVLIPLNRDLISKVDKFNKELYMHLPEGLLDIYLNP